MPRTNFNNSLLERRDVIVVASVACIYASSNPKNYEDMFFTLKVGEFIDRQELIKKLILRQYVRNDVDKLRGSFSVKGDIIVYRLLLKVQTAGRELLISIHVC